MRLQATRTILQLVCGRREGEAVSKRLRSWFVSVVACAAVAAACVAPPPAGAGTGLLSTCTAPIAQPFLPWLDPLGYSLVPGGSFETGDPAWSLPSGAGPAAGNEPWHVAGPGGRSLAVPNGATVVSPTFCIGLLAPTTRFFVRSTSLLGVSTVAVSVDLDTGAGQLTLPVGVVAAGPGWEPSLPLPLLTNLTSILGGSFATAR